MTPIKPRAVFAFLALAGFSVPAFTQPAAAQPLAPTATPAAPPSDSSPFSAMAAPKAGDDLTGSIGFGVGVVAGTALIAPNSTLRLKYWMNDNLAIVPELDFGYSKSRAPLATRASDATWGFAPQVTVLYVPWRATSTRLSVGAGLTIAVGSPNPGNDTEVAFGVPIYAGVEHFFTRWFSMGIGMSQYFLGYESGQNDAWAMKFGVNSTKFDGFLMFYTD